MAPVEKRKKRFVKAKQTPMAVVEEDAAGEEEVPSPEPVVAEEAREGEGEGDADEVSVGPEWKGLSLRGETLRFVQESKFETPTPIQKESIPRIKAGYHLIGQAKTGSGKTLSFLIPAIENMVDSHFKTRNGTAILIISPIRELCLQIHHVVTDLLAHYKGNHTHACCTGGTQTQKEADRLARGVNVVVATPGRLLDHLQNASGWVYENLQTLVIDEADRILQQGFEEEMNQIMKLLPRNRQTVLFSATQTTKVEELSKVSIPNMEKCVYVNTNAVEEAPTNTTLTQGYVVVPADKRFLLLFTFLRRYKDKKVIVFFSACRTVEYYTELLNHVMVSCSGYHGKQKQAQRQNTYMQFCNADHGILLSTDVAARGLDIPEVDWIIQFDPPDQPQEYIHRVGRTARAGKRGNALLFLMPEEVKFLSYLKASKVELNEYSFPYNKLPDDVQRKLEHLVSTQYYLSKTARDAYRAYLHAYNSHSLKTIFNVEKLDLKKLARSFGLPDPPTVDFSLADSTRGKRKLGRGFGSELSQKHKSVHDPYRPGNGKGDGRQWARS